MHYDVIRRISSFTEPIWCLQNASFLSFTPWGLYNELQMKQGSMVKKTHNYAG